MNQNMILVTFRPLELDPRVMDFTPSAPPPKDERIHPLDPGPLTVESAKRFAKEYRARHLIETARREIGIIYMAVVAGKLTHEQGREMAAGLLETVEGLVEQINP